MNTARVETRRNDVIWPLRAGRARRDRPRTPTLDPDQTSNVTTIETTIVCPALKVDKTVSFDGKCPGKQGPVVNQPGRAVTFCFEVTNTGDTFLSTIGLTDTIRTRTGTMVLFTTTIGAGWTRRCRWRRARR